MLPQDITYLGKGGLPAEERIVRRQLIVEDADGIPYACAEGLAAGKRDEIAEGELGRDVESDGAVLALYAGTEVGLVGPQGLFFELSAGLAHVYVGDKGCGVHPPAPAERVADAGGRAEVEVGEAGSDIEIGPALVVGIPGAVLRCNDETSLAVLDDIVQALVAGMEACEDGDPAGAGPFGGQPYGAAEAGIDAVCEAVVEGERVAAPGEAAEGGTRQDLHPEARSLLGVCDKAGLAKGDGEKKDKKGFVAHSSVFLDYV